MNSCTHKIKPIFFIFSVKWSECFLQIIVVIHNFRTVDETGYMLLLIAKKGVGNPQKLKIELALKIQLLTLSWVEAEYLYKTNTVMKMEVNVNDGPNLVHRPQGERFNLHYMSTCKFNGRVSVQCWGWISYKGAGVPHLIEGQLDGLHISTFFRT